jgi:hypothetical protein
VQLRDLNVALVQLPLIDADPAAVTANVPLAAGCLRAFAAGHGGPEPARIRVLPRSLAGHGGDEAILGWLAAGGFDVVGFTAYLWNVDRALLLAGRLRDRCPGTRTVFGGPEVAPGSRVLGSPSVDSCVDGEGETAFLDVLSGLAAAPDPHAGVPSGGAAAPRRYRAAGPLDLSSLPNPYLAGLVERDAADPVYLETVRGCLNRCSYCSYAREYPGVRCWPAGALDAVFPWAALNAVPEIYLMDPTFNGMPGWEAKLEAIAALNATGIPLHTELRLESIDEHHAALFGRAGFRSVEAGLQSTNSTALRAVRRTWDRDRFLRGAAALQAQGIAIRTGVILGLPGDTPEGFRSTIRFVKDAGLADGLEVYPLAVLPGTDLRRDAAALGLAHMGFPPYHVLETPTMSAGDIAGSIRWLERAIGADFFAPIAPAFADPAPGLIGFLDLRLPRALEAARSAPDRLANRLTLLAGDELLGRAGLLEEFGRWLISATPSSLVQLVLETDSPLAAGRLDGLAEAFHDSAHYLNRERHLDDDSQGRASIRLYRLTRDARVAARAAAAGEACEAILRWPARPHRLARRLLRDRPFLLPDAGLDARERRDLLARYRGGERLVLTCDRPL